MTAAPAIAEAAPMADGQEREPRLAGIPAEDWRAGMALWKEGAPMVEVCRRIGYPHPSHIYGVIKATPWLREIYEAGRERRPPRPRAAPLAEEDWAAALEACRKGALLKEICAGAHPAPTIKQWERRWRLNPEFRREVEAIRAALSREREAARLLRRREAWRAKGRSRARIPMGEALKGALLRDETYRAIHACVPRRWAEPIREDVISILVVLVLEGRAAPTRAGLRQSLPEALRRFNLESGRWRARARDLYAQEMAQAAEEAAEAAGRKTTGGTVYRLDAGYDTGPILLQRSCAILPGESPAELWRRALAPMGADMLEGALRSLSREF